MVGITEIRSLKSKVILNVGGALIVLLSHQPVFAETFTEGIKKQILEAFNSGKTNLEELETQKRETLGALYKINQMIQKINIEKARLMENLLSQESKVNDLTNVLDGLQAKISSEKKKLRAQLRTITQLSGQGALRLVFSNKTSHDLDRDLKFLNLMVGRNYKGLKEYHKLIAYNHQQKIALTENLKKYEDLKNRIKVKEDSLLAKQHQKKTLISTVEQRRRIQISTIGSLRDKTKDLISSSGSGDSDLKRVLQKSFFEQRGRLQNPIKGKVTQEFGLTKDAKFNLVMSSKGRQYSSRLNETVRSVYSGVVGFVGQLKTFGKTLIIDHGDHYYSVYANLAAIDVSVGDSVDALQAIAKAGNSGKFGTGLYFEIRHFSEPEDPKRWILTDSDGAIP